MRLRDTRTGDTYDVPLAPGVRFTPPGKNESGTAEATPSPASAPAPTEAKSSPPAEKRAKRKSSQQKSSRSKAGHYAPDSSDEAKTRVQSVDEQTLATDDRAKTEKRQTSLRRSAGLVEGKKGGLGWQETTDAGRSGLRARFRAGAFKILHVGGDTYALFYEWDTGKYERIACGAAEDLMKIAAERTQEELPKPPQSLVDQDLARFYCGSAQPRDAEERPPPEPYTTPARPRRPRRSTTSAAPETTPATPPTETPAPVPTSSPVDAKLDESLMASFKQALAELED